MAEVMQIQRNEEDTQRVYSVDDVCEGKSGIIVADLGTNGNWALSVQEPPALNGGEETSCKQAVAEHIENLKLEVEERREEDRLATRRTADAARRASARAAGTEAGSSETPAS